MNQPKVILYIAASVDGYIAKPGDDLSFLSMVEKEGEDYGYTAFMRDVDTVIMGRKTHDWVVKATGAFPHQDKKVFVITRTPRPAMEETKYYNGDLVELIKHIKNQGGKNIFCDGGAEIVRAFLHHDLIDEFVISIIPVLLGGGKRLFMEDGYAEKNLELLNVKSYEKGLVQLHYRRTR